MNPIPACTSDLTLIAGWERDWHHPVLNVTIPARETWRFKRVGGAWVRIHDTHAVSSPLEAPPAGFEGAGVAEGGEGVETDVEGATG